MRRLTKTLHRRGRRWLCTHRAGAGVSAQLGRLLAGRRALGLVDAGIVLRVDPLHLAGGLLEGVEAALCALHPHLLVLRDGVQGLDDRVRSLAAACGHLCDTYLPTKRGEPVLREVDEGKHPSNIMFGREAASGSLQTTCCFSSLAVSQHLLLPVEQRFSTAGLRPKRGS